MAHDPPAKFPSSDSGQFRVAVVENRLNDIGEQPPGFFASLDMGRHANGSATAIVILHRLRKTAL